jgi:hypothetical protein
MKPLALLLAAALPLLALPAQAQIVCHADQFNNAICRDGRGNAIRGRADDQGRLVWRDNRGRVVTGYTDARGHSVLLGPDGARIVGHEDPAGNSAWVLPNGRTVRGHSDPRSGNSVYRDSRGNVLRCHDDGRGHEICVSGREPH